MDGLRLFGGVQVSPFISKAEKAIRDKGIEAGASLIIVCKADLSGRFKPSGRDFEMCAQDRFLTIAPIVKKEASEAKSLTRKEALEMNRIASLIVDLNEKTEYKIVSTFLK